MNWKKMTEKPEQDGLYIVLMSNPYSEKMHPVIGHFMNGCWMDSKAGCNHYIFWQEIPNVTEEMEDYREAYNKKIIFG